MDEFTADAFANRNEPVPVISPPTVGNDSPKRPGPTQRHSFDSGLKRSIQDRLFSQVLNQVIPPEDTNDDTVSVGDRPVDASTKRPAFSLGLMSNNFRRFNARIGIVFLFQNKVERLLSWEKSSHTISFLFVYSFICLDPYLLAILPITISLLFIMVPAFLARHPPPPSTSTSSATPYYSIDGPAMAPAKTIKPASETSKDFFRNLRDLQNCMADYADLHDAAISLLAPVTNFSNEKLSSATFLLCTVSAVALFLTAHLLPWRFILLAGGNAAILSNNPTVQDFFRHLASDLAKEGQDLNVPSGGGVTDMTMPSSPSAAMSLMGSIADISLDAYPEEREVEMFELQSRSLESYSESKWDHFLFTSMPYDPLSPSRIAGVRPRGCRFFEDVQPPTGWAWKSKKWELDLDCREWVVDRMITGVAFEVSGNETANDEVGGWVWDLSSSSSEGEQEVIGALGHAELASEPRRLSKSQQKRPSSVKDWDERSIGSQAVGDWRRRRWVRVVHRVSVPENDE